MCSDSEKNMSAYADQNHAPSLTCVRLEVPNYVKRDDKKVENTKFLRSEKDIIRLKTL